jgi:hypothetical protein
MICTVFVTLGQLLLHVLGSKDIRTRSSEDFHFNFIEAFQHIVIRFSHYIFCVAFDPRNEAVKNTFQS